jgi:hypothetical protein
MKPASFTACRFHAPEIFKSLGMKVQSFKGKGQRAKGKGQWAKAKALMNTIELD